MFFNSGGWTISLALITYMSFLSAILIFILCYYQLQMIASETTTFEIMRRGNQGRDPCTWRGFKNIGYFLWTGRYFLVDETGLDDMYTMSDHSNNNNRQKNSHSSKRGLHSRHHHSNNNNNNHSVSGIEASALDKHV
jgi:hypothetical protein